MVAVVENETAAAPAVSWADLGTDPRIVDALVGAGMTAPFPIQSMTLPVAVAGSDVIGQAKTGTGKTLGFGIPLLHRVTGPKDPGYADLASPGAPQALAIVPTRELATQVAEDLKVASKNLSVRILTVYGGRAYEPQVEALKKGIEVVVGTPGRLLDLAQQGLLNLGNVRTLVLDEADEMLDLGFLPDVEKLMSLTPDGRQTMLFSATMPGAVVSLARKYMTQPTHIRASDPDDSGATVLAIAQFIYRAHAMDKVEMVARLLQAEGRGLSIIFTRTKRTAAKVADELADRGFAAAAIHGDLGQGAREQALRAFRNGKIDVLVATDVAARGIDVENVTHVVNYACPEDEKTYLHRIGRTGRAGNTGVAVTFVDWDDLHRWMMIDKALDLGIPEPAETYSTSPHFSEDLHIPAGVKGTLPRASRTRAGLDAEELEDLGETGKRGGGAKPASRRDGGRDSGRDGGRDGSRDGARGGRSRSRGRGSDALGSGEQAGDVEAGESVEGGEEQPREPRTRRPRQRRRTRNGLPVEGGTEGSPEDGTPGDVEGGAVEAAPNGADGDESTPATGPDSSEPKAPSRRGRRRSASSTSDAEDAGAEGTDAGTAEADDAGENGDGEGDAQKRRRRRRRGTRGSGSSAAAPAENAPAPAGSADS
ncbi:DEAD/DEAH box helicase [Kineosporia succinea]|uniref:DEAD/DEAH box helicase n=1 Tax=Kineosporia succinea TaxID=84632 RepID=UPI003F9BB54B